MLGRNCVCLYPGCTTLLTSILPLLFTPRSRVSVVSGVSGVSRVSGLSEVLGLLGPPGVLGTSGISEISEVLEVSGFGKEGAVDWVEEEDEGKVMAVKRGKEVMGVEVATGIETALKSPVSVFPVLVVAVSESLARA